MNELLYGTPCIIAKQIKMQKKTSKCKLLNWFYKKIYGYEYESAFPVGTDVIWFDNKLIFRNQEVFDKLKEGEILSVSRELL